MSYEHLASQLPNVFGGQFGLEVHLKVTLNSQVVYVAQQYGTVLRQIIVAVVRA
jgi:hypothetical protein